MIKKTLLNFWLLLLCMIVGVSSAWGTDYNTVLTLDCATPAPTSSTSTAFSNTSDIATFLNSAAGLSSAENKITCSAKGGDVYKGKGSGGGDIPQQCLKVGKASGPGSFTFTIPNTYASIDKVEITCYGWKTTSSISINSGTAQTFTTAQTETTKEFELASASRTISIAVTTSAVCITEIVLKSKVAAPVTHTLTYSATNGTIAGVDASSNAVASGGSIAESATVTLTATPSDGYEFLSWNVEGTDATLSSTTDNPTTFTMGTADATVTANFVVSATSDYITVSPTTKNITSSAGYVEFTISTDQTLYDDPTQFYTTADADETASKPDWITEALYDEGTLLLTVAANTGAARTAYFKVENGSVKSDVITITQAAKKYEIAQYTAPATAHGTITFSHESPVDAGAEVTLTATPASGYSFTADSWKFYKESAGDFVVDESISVTDNKFIMPAYDIYVDGTFTAIAVTGVTLNKSTASIGVGDTETLTATVAPSNALNKAVTWTSSNTSVATVSEGVVTAVAAGSATITVTTTDGSFTATCAVTVVNAVTFTAGTDKGTTTSNADGDEVTKSVITISSDIAAFATDQYRLYSGSTSTISTSAGKITKIEFTVNGSYLLSNLNTSTGTYNSSTGVWTGVATSIAFSATAQVRLDKIKVYYATTATPTFSVDEGEYSEAKSVELSCATDGATIYYTTDGTDPDEDSYEYTSAISITETTTLKAIAIKSDVESSVASATYTMNRPAAPTFDVATCVFDKAFDLHLSAADGTTIYYTTDGSTPTSSSSAYSTKVDISAATTTVKAIAVKDGLTSDVASETYTYDSRTTPTFTLSTTSLDLKVNETSSAVTLTTNSDATPSFSCADAHVTLTGTGNSRTISANAAGTYTVNVGVSGSATYKDAAGTITVTVTKKATTMVLTPFFTSKDLYVTKSGSLTGAPQYNSSDIAGAVVTYSSSDTKVATIAADGTVTFKKAGSTILKASYAGTAEYDECEATYELTLVDTTPQETEVDITLNNTFMGIDAITTWQTGDPTTATGTEKNISVTYSKGTSKFFYCNAEKIRFYTDNTFTIEAPSGYHVISVDMNVTISSATPTGTISSDTWTGDAASVSFTFDNKTDISSITVTIAPTITISAAKYATYCSQHDLDFSDTGIKVYKAKVNSEKKVVKLTEISNGIVPAETGVILYKDVDETTTIAVPVTTTDATITDNDLVGTTARVLVKKTEDDENFNYILQAGPVFNMATAEGAYMPANRAYLSTTVDASAGGARLSVVFDDDVVTGVTDVRSKTEEGRGEYFNLKGQRVENPKKGSIYVKNGKKVIFK